MHENDILIVRDNWAGPGYLLYWTGSLDDRYCVRASDDAYRTIHNAILDGERLHGKTATRVLD